MAWVKNFEKKEGAVRQQPTQVVAFVKVADLPDSSPIVQIDTYGSADREIPGKQSQTIQLGREAAEQLYRILRDTYGFKA
ncbi:MAG: hypothetical protein K2Y29_15165 [Beijerinckiaceae bacterium]|nr:hypothetical protein [Beijerinckiaceae bacterium]